MISAPVHIKLVPHISEKSYGLSENANTYVFEVPRSLNKHQVKDSVEKQFKVTVTDVRTLTAKGKPKSSARKRRQPMSGQRATIKKAYVTLKSGDKIKVFEEAK